MWIRIYLPENHKCDFDSDSYLILHNDKRYTFESKDDVVKFRKLVMTKTEQIDIVRIYSKSGGISHVFQANSIQHIVALNDDCRK